MSKYKDSARVGMALLVLGWAAMATQAADSHPSRLRPVAVDGFHRAGHPELVHRWSRPTEHPDFWGGYVGGGAPCLGEHRCADEGTWGWDYRGSLIPKRIWLGWWHGRRSQGGTGSYNVDGPQLPRH